jgi:ribosomal protein S18 acetylase RimI-like enzyme
MAHVRPFESRDASRASEILVAAFRGFLRDRFDDNLAAHFAPELLTQNTHVVGRFSESRLFVAEDGDRVVGVVSVSAGSNGLGTFNYVGVDPDCQSQGIGSLLMARAVEFWTEHRQRKIDTCVSAHNKKALMYYLKHDFVPEGYRRDHFIPGVDEIILGRFMKKEQ